MSILLPSRFVHVFRRDDMVALYHSLRMRPIYFSSREWDSLSKSLGISEESMELIIDQKVSDSLYEAKIFVQSPADDDRVIDFFRSNFGRPEVSIVYFVLTDKCNFSCSYCFVRNSMPDGYQERTMSMTTADRGLDRFCEIISRNQETFSKEKTIIFYGGEPLMNTKVLSYLLDKIRAYKLAGKLPEKTSLSLVTNGSLITEKIAKLLKEHAVSVGISIDGDEAVTSANREGVKGNPIYSNVMRGFKICTNAGVDVGVSCTLSVESVKNFQKTMKTLVDDLRIAGMGFNLAMATPGYPLPNGYAEEASKCIIDAYKVFRERGIYEDRIMRKVNAFVEAKVYPYDCGAAGGGQIVIAPDGQIGVCHGYLGERKFFCSHVQESSFDPETDPVFLEWSRRSPLFMEECQRCSALGICGGGCPLQADIDTGSIWGLDSRFCVHSKKTLEWLIWDLYDQFRK